MSEFFSCLLHESGVIGCFFLSTFIRSFVIFGLSGTFFLLFLCILFHCFFFFFQAEDGIRDRDVTGVQTCALPISKRPAIGRPRWIHRPGGQHVLGVDVVVAAAPEILPADDRAACPVANDRREVLRSEERRVGKECRSGWSPYE